jgi:lipid II:glycine glycyltransferase (peptidoglycan interpeptide bridge formation enzyme)
MISFTKKFFFLKVCEKWFASEPRFSDIFSLTAYLNVQNSEQKRVLWIKKITHSVQNSLLSEINTILLGFDGSIRNQINKAEKEGIECSYQKDIDNFVDFFNAFVVRVRIPPTSRRRLEEMGDNLILSFAKLNGEILSAHAYVVDNEVSIVYMLHSASRRFDDSFDRAQIGRSGKLLHYKDMLYFKEKGFQIYDMGGFAENTKDEGLAGINSFKLSFGGKKVVCVHYYSVGYKLLNVVYKLLGLNIR